MLRLKACLDECGIPHKDLATATGWSKTQISITLNSGRLPANAEKFRDDVHNFIVADYRIRNWLDTSGLQIVELFEMLAEPEPATETGGLNEHGEPLGGGPQWACSDYGRPGHDYQYCHDCHRKYAGHMQRARGRAVVMGASA